MISITQAIRNGFYKTFCLKDTRLLIPIVAFFLISIASTLIGNISSSQPYAQSGFYPFNSTMLGQMLVFTAWAFPSVIALFLLSLFFFGFTIIAYSSRKTRSSIRLMKDTAKHYLGLLAISILLAIILAAGFIALVIPGIFLSVKLAFSQMFVMLKRSSPGKALNDSYDMTRGRFWDVLAMLLVVGVIASIVEGIMSMAFLLQPIYAISVVVESLLGAFFTVAFISVVTDYFLQIHKKINI